MLCTSYPIPFTRMNVDQWQLRVMNGYISDATHLNPSDPNSMVDQGRVRNCTYNFALVDAPADYRFDMLPSRLPATKPIIINQQARTFGRRHKLSRS